MVNQKVERILRAWSNRVDDEQFEMIELGDSFEERYYTLKGKVKELFKELKEMS